MWFRQQIRILHPLVSEDDLRYLVGPSQRQRPLPSNWLVRETEFRLEHWLSVHGQGWRTWDPSVDGHVFRGDNRIEDLVGRPFRYPVFTTPYWEVAAGYGECVYQLHIAAGTPYWLLPDRPTEAAAGEIAAILSWFIERLRWGGRNPRVTRPGRNLQGREREESHIDAFRSWRNIQESRSVSYPGDVVTAVIGILRKVGIPMQTLPPMVVFDGRWDLRRGNRWKSDTPEVIIFDFRAVRAVEEVASDPDAD